MSQAWTWSRRSSVRILQAIALCSVLGACAVTPRSGDGGRSGDSRSGGERTSPVTESSGARPGSVAGAPAGSASPGNRAASATGADGRAAAGTAPAAPTGKADNASGQATSPAAGNTAGSGAPGSAAPGTVAGASGVAHAPIIESTGEVPTISADEASAALERAKARGDLWTRIRKGFALPPLNSPLVADKERYYLQRPDYLDRMMARGSRYLFHIVEEVEKRGLPTELALLPFVESAMNPVALSGAQASGLWQFMPSTGKYFNLSQNWWVDNRRDVVHSTRAALDYLQKLHQLHNRDWFLALASYNWGEGAVGRSVRRNRARGLPAEYLTLDMPTETRHYVPKLIAMKNIIARAPELGVVLPDLPNRPYFVSIEKTRPIDLKLAAQFAGMEQSDFVALNPAHNRPVIAATKGNEIKLPADRVESFLANVAKHDHSKRAFTTWQPYTLKSGDTLESVAQSAGISAAELQKANSLKQQSRILPGTQILAPVANGVADERKVASFVAPRVYEQVNSPAQYHSVGKRETLQSIAGRYKLSPRALSAMNPGKKFQKGNLVMVRPASSHTLLTNEFGQRQVVAHRVQPQAGDGDEEKDSQRARKDTPKGAQQTAQQGKPAQQENASRKMVQRAPSGKAIAQAARRKPEGRAGGGIAHKAAARHGGRPAAASPKAPKKPLRAAHERKTGRG